jgi:hypothetical protein
MTLDELRSALEVINAQSGAERIRVRKEYVDSNNPYKIGDIIQDSETKIQIELMQHHLGIEKPCMVYMGIRLKKDNTPFKSGERAEIFQRNIIN